MKVSVPPLPARKSGEAILFFPSVCALSRLSLSSLFLLVSKECGKQIIHFQGTKERLICMEFNHSKRKSYLSCVENHDLMIRKNNNSKTILLVLLYQMCSKLTIKTPERCH